MISSVNYCPQRNVAFCAAKNKPTSKVTYEKTHKGKVIGSLTGIGLGVASMACAAPELIARFTKARKAFHIMGLGLIGLGIGALFDRTPNMVAKKIAEAKAQEV